MTDPAALWYAEHANLARLLDLLEEQVAVFNAGDQPNYDLLLDIVHYLTHYPDQIHHPKEDVAFARLVKHDPQMKPQIDQLTQEHRVIATAGGVLLKHLEEVLAGSVEPRSLLEAAAATYLAYYRGHLAAEDKEVVPRAAQLLTAADWAAVAKAVPSRPDPLLGEHVETHYRKLRRQIELESQSD